MNNLSEFFKTKSLGLIVCLAIAIPAWFLGNFFPIIGGPVFAILAGMLISMFFKPTAKMDPGIKFTSKKILQWAVILLGFGLNLNVVIHTGQQSLPIIVCTIGISLIAAYVMQKILKIHPDVAIMVGVGSSICGGSAVAATAPVINAEDEEVAQSISIIFFFNVIAALIFPTLGSIIGFSTTSGEGFGIFAGTAVNDTSSVTACASTWDSLYNLGSATLDKAVTVKLTRTLAIIPITLALAIIHAEKLKHEGGNKVSIKSIFPFFIIYFIAASIITTTATSLGVSAEVFTPFKMLSKFFIVMAMAGIGLHTDLIKLLKTGAKPLLIGFVCWVSITLVSIGMQHVLGLL